jgi:UDP-GlcNAc:undecaprenyl-phosphate GlcNAc-1-phosphate transferase
VPLADVALAIIRRILRRRPIFAPDKEHIHHQLRKIGHTDRRAVFTMYLWSVLLAGAALGVALIRRRSTIAVVVAVAIVLIAATLVPSRVRRFRAHRAERRLGPAGAASTPSPAEAPKRVQEQQGA